MKTVEVYTDGACSKNPGPGGWAAILIFNGIEKELSGYVPDTTNNRMEIYAIIKALETLKNRCYVRVHTDSAYVYNAFAQNWIEKWQCNNWKTFDRKPVANQDLWLKLITLSTQHEFELIKVKGHAFNELNNRCDKLARNAIKKGVSREVLFDNV